MPQLQTQMFVSLKKDQDNKKSKQRKLARTVCCVLKTQNTNVKTSQKKRGLITVTKQKGVQQLV